MHLPAKRCGIASGFVCGVPRKRSWGQSAGAVLEFRVDVGARLATVVHTGSGEEVSVDLRALSAGPPYCKDVKGIALLSYMFSVRPAPQARSFQICVLGLRILRPAGIIFAHFLGPSQIGTRSAPRGILG